MLTGAHQTQRMASALTFFRAIPQKWRSWQRISTGSCLTTLFATLISLHATATCLLVPTWRTEWDHSASTIMRSWWKVLKRDWAYRRQTSLTHAYKNLFPDINASISAVTTLRSCLSTMCVFFVHNKTFFLIACFVNSSPEVTFE
jgi:hypothetical protein